MTALFGLRSSYYNQILLLGEMEADNVLESVSVETPQRLRHYFYKILLLLSALLVQTGTAVDLCGFN